MDFCIYTNPVTCRFAGWIFSRPLGGVGTIMGPVHLAPQLPWFGSEPGLTEAFATSLTATIPTAMSGAAGHYNKGAVDSKPALIIGIPSFLAAFLWAIITSKAPASTLSVVFEL